MPEFKIKYKKSIDYKMVPVSGVWGGLSAEGNVTCEFYLEKVDHPDSTTIIVDDKKRIIVDKAAAGKSLTNSLIREFQVGMSITPQLAKAIGQWLINKANEFEKAKEAEKHGNPKDNPKN